MALQVLSLGAGVQSSTLLLMACRGQIRRPDVAIFADTGWEPKAVYKWLEFLRSQALSSGIQLETVSAGNIKSNALGILPRVRQDTQRFVTIPLFTRSADGKISMLRRQCTKEYKIYPIRRRIREKLQALGLKPTLDSAELWMGITTDEAARVRLSDVRYIRNVFPLIERGMDRRDCIDWLLQNGYSTAPKSSCIGCPFHDDRYWRNQELHHPDEFAEAVEVDRAIRKLPRLKDEAFLYRKAIPLEQASFALPTDGMEPLFDGMADECLGMCGV